MRKLKIILFLHHATKFPTEAEKIDFAKMTFYYWGQKQNQIQQNFIVVL